jgi:5-methylcytosine-specific restriction endonuclease McrBC regulatory subunit McrC
LRTRYFGHGILNSKAEIRANVSQIEYATPTYKRNDLQKIIKANIKIVNHPYFTKYRDLQKLCLQILREEGTSFGNKDEIHGLLFDGAWLWEEYINVVIGKEFWHPNNEKGTCKQHLFCDENGKEKGLIYPDFISKNKESRVIADAKYKPIDNILGKDYLQLVAYMYRFDSKRGYYIYPNKGVENLYNDYKLQQGANISGSENVGVRNCDEIIVSKYGLAIPQISDSLEDFCAKIEKNEELIKKEIK